MKVKDIISIALNYVERGDINDALQSDAELSEEQSATLKTILFCYNSVEHELARHYFPLERTESLTSTTGKYLYSAFLDNPIKILEVTYNGKPCVYSVEPKQLRADYGAIKVRYRYTPSNRQLDDECSFSGVNADERLIAAGTASEYCLLNGEIKLAELWESRYRSYIDRCADYKGLNIPPRRWV